MTCECKVADADLYSMSSVSDNYHLELALHLPNCKRSGAQFNEIQQMLIDIARESQQFNAMNHKDEYHTILIYLQSIHKQLGNEMNQ